MYEYKNMREEIFTDDGQKSFLKIRDKANKFLDSAGAFILDKIISGETGNTDMIIACVDRMVELGEIKEIKRKNTFGQYRVFIRG